MEWNVYLVRRPDPESTVGYFMDVWLDTDTGPPLHTFEFDEPVYLHHTLMGRKTFPTYWIERFEGYRSESWTVRVRTERRPTENTDYMLVPVSDLVPVPAMLRIALAASD